MFIKITIALEKLLELLFKIITKGGHIYIFAIILLHIYFALDTLIGKSNTLINVTL